MIHKVSRNMVLVVLLLVVVIASVRVQPVKADTQPVWVAADAGWVETGVTVSADQSVNIVSVGVALTANRSQFFGAISGPAGQPYPCIAPPDCALNGEAFGALVGKVGTGGTPFLIGSSSSFTAPASGMLYLAVNDYQIYYSDNKGGFLVLFK